MNHVLYEASFKFHFAFLIPVFMMIFIAVFPFIIKKTYESKDVKINFKFVKSFCTGGFLFVATVSIIALLFQVNMYHKTIGAYKQGEYQIVEGYIENFVPMPYTGHSYESFDINGVSFSYSDFDIQPGYNNTKSHGGVIIGDGQHLKIGYIFYNKTYGNIIVYIEELP